MDSGVDRLIPLAEVERSLGIKKSSVYKLVKDGKLSRPVHVVGRATWPESELKAFVEACKGKREAA